MNQKLTTRDIAIIMDVYKYRYLSTSQLKRLHFPSEKTTWRRLQILTELGFIKPFSVPNIPEYVYYLNKKGAEIVSIELDVEIEELDWHRHTRQPKDYYFLRHFLSINDFQMLLNNACQKSNMTLVRFIPEYIGTQTKDGHVKKLIRDQVNGLSHTPDAVFSLKKDDKPALFFLEIDRGNEVVSDPERGLLKAVVFYLNYWTSENWKQYRGFLGGDFKTFRTLIITTSKQRVQHLREATTLYPFDSHAKRFLWATVDSQVTEDWFFEPIWQSLETTDTNLYKIG
jgi:hypothetical protein